MTSNWHARRAEEIATELATHPSGGLESKEAARRLANEGRNEFHLDSSTPPWMILVGQFKSLVVAILFGAAAVSIGLGEYLDAAAIVAIVVLNGLSGFVQEYRAERAIAAIARSAAPRARVVRSGISTEIPAADVVRGDVLLLDAGDLVAADARLTDAIELRIDEAALTGESEPIHKTIEPCAADTGLADRKNMVFMGTSVTTGNGRALVVTTGMHTELGRIAGLLGTACRSTTPLQARLDQVARRLLWASAGVVVAVFLLGLVRGMALGELFLVAVSLAVAAIPEGLPAVVTIALALGVSRMVRRNTLVRRLHAVETLGAAQVICTDKTGTLTVGEMTARTIVTPTRRYTVTGEGYQPDGTILPEGEDDAAAEAELRQFVTAAAGCIDADIQTVDGNVVASGDPTEVALAVLAAKVGVGRAAIEVSEPRQTTIPFDSERRRMTVIRKRRGEYWAVVKGAPEVVLARCNHVTSLDGTQPFSSEQRIQMTNAAAAMADGALRVLAIAQRRFDSFPPRDEIESNLTLLGFVGLQDLPRPEAREAVTRCQRAGIRTVMITGDHPATARAIARELGILEHGGEISTGHELDGLTDTELRGRIRSIHVYARVTAEHKLRIVRAWKADGAVVAMTGDGVNDAPALEEASIGIAMGIRGTEVTKQAADMVITDDHFASIVAAIEEGRGIYDNIVKTLGYLLAGNSAELLLMLIAVSIGWPLPLLPIQLLWINLVTDGLPALALATDPVNPRVLDRPPRAGDDEILDGRFLLRIAVIGSLSCVVALACFAYELLIDGSLQDARNAAFSVLVLAELFRSFGARSETQLLWTVGLLSNLRLVLVVVASLFLQVAIHSHPTAVAVFGTEPITVSQGILWTLLGLLPLATIEFVKWLRLRRGSTDRTLRPMVAPSS